MVYAIQFSNKRVGSTFLQKAISSHLDLVGIDEVFVNMCRKSKYRKSGFIPYVRPENQHKTPEKYIKHIKKTHEGKGILMKLMYNQINFHGGLIQFIKDNEIPIIHLMRKNLVKQVISGKNAGTTKHNTITISPQELMRFTEEADNLNKWWATQLKNNIKLTLYYEDIIGNTCNNKTYVSDRVNWDICNMFDVKETLLYAETRKKNKEDLSVYLPNIEEIKKEFNSTKYKWMVE